MAENVIDTERTIETERTEVEQIIAEAEAITDSAARGLEAPENGLVSMPDSETVVQNNSASAAVASATIVSPARPVAPANDPEAAARREMNRREFLMYSWAGSLGLVTALSGFAMFEFLYPRFKAGEFGGKFLVPSGEVPANDAPPNGKYVDGKFWLVTTSEGTNKAIYMVCTHLGCLYKWSSSNFRFECPCHGSKFNHDGFYIEGPAPRSLDYFAVAMEGDSVVVDTGKKVTGSPAADSPAKVVIG